MTIEVMHRGKGFSVYAHTTTGRYRSGKRVVIFKDSGPGWGHIEIGPLALGWNEPGKW